MLFIRRGDFDDAIDQRVKRAQFSDVIDARFGFERYKDPITRMGWLINMHPVSIPYIVKVRSGKYL